MAIEFEKNNFNEDVNIEVRINEKEKFVVTKEEMKIKKEQLSKDCGKENNLCKMKVSISNSDPTRIYLIAQHTNKDIRLLEGLAFRFKGSIKEFEPKHFTYFVANNIDTIITLENRVGYYKIYAKLIPDSQFNSDFNSTFPT